MQPRRRPWPRRGGLWLAALAVGMVLPVVADDSAAGIDIDIAGDGAGRVINSESPHPHPPPPPPTTGSPARPTAPQRRRRRKRKPEKDAGALSAAQICADDGAVALGQHCICAHPRRCVGTHCSQGHRIEDGIMHMGILSSNVGTNGNSQAHDEQVSGWALGRASKPACADCKCSAEAVANTTSDVLVHREVRWCHVRCVRVYHELIILSLSRSCIHPLTLP